MDYSLLKLLFLIFSVLSSDYLLYWNPTYKKEEKVLGLRHYKININNFLKIDRISRTSNTRIDVYTYLGRKLQFSEAQKQPMELFCKKGVYKDLANFTRKHLCQSLFFNKVAGSEKHLFHRTTPGDYSAVQSYSLE